MWETQGSPNSSAPKLIWGSKQASALWKCPKETPAKFLLWNQNSPVWHCTAQCLALGGCPSSLINEGKSSWALAMSATLHISLTFFPLESTEPGFCAYPALKIFLWDSNIFKQQACKHRGCQQELPHLWDRSCKVRGVLVFQQCGIKMGLKMGLTLEPQEDEDLNKPGWAKENLLLFSYLKVFYNWNFKIKQKVPLIHSLNTEYSPPLGQLQVLRPRLSHTRDSIPISGHFAEPEALIKNTNYGTAQQPTLGGQSYLGVFNNFEYHFTLWSNALNFLHSYSTCWFLFKEHLGESQSECVGLAPHRSRQTRNINPNWNKHSQNF